MNTIRNDILKSTATVFERADAVEAQLNRFLKEFHGNVQTKDSQFVDYLFIGNTDWSDYTDYVEHECYQVRELFKEVFMLRKLGTAMVKLFARKRQVSELNIKMIQSWKHHLDRLKEKLMHYNYSVVEFDILYA